MEAEIISVGTEILLGEIVDTNTRTIALALRDIGLDIYRTATVGDNAQRIAQAVQDSLSRAAVVILTGGLGPTVDDVTREGVAEALDVELVYHPELWDQIIERAARFGIKPTENNRRQAHLPEGATPFENPIGSAPGFVAHDAGAYVFAMPGVPAEMKYLLAQNVVPYLQDCLDLKDVILTRLLHTTGLGESKVDEAIQDLERFTNPTVGLAAHPGQVDIRITAKAPSETEANAMIAEVEKTVRQRLGDAIFGSDDETLEEIAIQVLAKRGWRLAAVECGTGSALTSALSPFSETFAGGQLIACQEKSTEVEGALENLMAHHKIEVGLGLSLFPSDRIQRVELSLRQPGGGERLERQYGGPPIHASRWAVCAALNLLRKRLS
jgi:nicotinamide-nucleotide amidase